MRKLSHEEISAKRFSLEEIKTITNKFVPKLAWTMKKERCYDLKSFLKLSFQQ